MKNIFFLNFSLILIYFYDVECMTVIPERANIIYTNPKYLENTTITVRRYSRKSPYYINLVGFTKHEWNNNITVDVVLKQFLHNEYRRSFIEMHYKLCDFINKEPFVGGAAKNAGLRCPMPAGHQAMVNMTAPTENFPNVFPFERGSVDIDVSVTGTKELVMQLSIKLTFIQKKIAI
ncbi:uncharacterized protein LOC124631545 [Helicoverpa zea]|uniref:uncharacterized protein LOC124631545 n=1 Tax=Helicoverpa zea TaxID=7113 RepID=UPI001F58231C|nr:uncharacterized protein LOC124631545 [Helicoverpa zea]